MRQGCGAINAADERKIKAATFRRDHAAPTARTMRVFAVLLSVDTGLVFLNKVSRSSIGETQRPTMLAGSLTAPEPWREKYAVCL